MTQHAPPPSLPSPQPPLWLVSLLYYVVWIATIQLAAHEHPLSAAALHLLFGGALIALSPAEDRASLWRRALLGSGVGVLFDSALVAIGLVSFPSHSLLIGLSPLWMVSLWFTFATLLNTSLLWLLGKPKWAISLGLLGGPMSYLGGAQSGAMLTHGALWWLALLLGIGWAVLMALAVSAWSPSTHSTHNTPLKGAG